MLYLIERRTVGDYAAAVVVFLVVGSSVEFWWPALAFGVAVWWYCKQPDWKPVGIALAALAVLWFVNSNLWVLAAVPVLLLVSRLDLRLRLGRVGSFTPITPFTSPRSGCSESR